jgi:hypothetical protein
MTKLVPTVSDIKVGDKITMNVPVKRRWWALWKPKYRSELRTFTVIST